MAVHPAEENDRHELYLMTDDVADLVASMARRGIEATPISEQGWGRLTHVTLPGGGKLGIYQPRHASPPAHRTPRKRPIAKRRTSSASRRRRTVR